MRTTLNRNFFVSGPKFAVFLAKKFSMLLLCLMMMIMMRSLGALYVDGAGDAYRYTIQPVFDNISARRHCHIRRRRPDSSRGTRADPTADGARQSTQASDVVYDVFYYVQLPASGGGGAGFKTEPVRRTIRLTQAELNAVASGSSHRVDFLDVEHDAGLQLKVCLFVCPSVSLPLFLSLSIYFCLHL